MGDGYTVQDCMDYCRTLSTAALDDMIQYRDASLTMRDFLNTYYELGDEAWGNSFVSVGPVGNPGDPDYQARSHDSDTSLLVGDCDCFPAAACTADTELAGSDGVEGFPDGDTDSQWYQADWYNWQCTYE